MEDLTFPLVYKFAKPEGYQGCRCKIIQVAQGERVFLLFDDGRRLMRSKFSVTSVAKWEESLRTKAEMVPCPRCGGKGKIKKETEVI